MIQHGIYAELQQKMRPIRLGVIPELGMLMERVVAHHCGPRFTVISGSWPVIIP